MATADTADRVLFLKQKLVIPVGWLVNGLRMTAGRESHGTSNLTPACWTREGALLSDHRQVKAVRPFTLAMYQLMSVGLDEMVKQKGASTTTTVQKVVAQFGTTTENVLTRWHRRAMHFYIAVCP
jgi:hypothetical protein